MRFSSSLMAFLRNFLQRERSERDLAEEVDSYLALSAEGKMRAGLDETAARREAATEFGGVEQVKEEVRDVRFGHFLETRLQDLRFAFRTLRKSPVFSLTVVSVLALGIGSTALIFSIVYALLLRGPDFPEADRIFMLWQRIPQEDRVSFSIKEYRAWREQNAVFDELGIYTGSGLTMTGRGEPESVHGESVTPSFFRLLGAQPLLGRAFLEAEGEAGQNQQVILSYGLWRQRFGGRPDSLGETLLLNDKPYTVVGVMPESFDFPSAETKVWLPVDLKAPLFTDNPDAHFLRVIGRLKPGVSRERLQAEIAVLRERVLDPKDGKDRQIFALSLQEMTSGDLRGPLRVLLVAVGSLLLIACANVANLMLARANARQGEMALRAALGASRPRLIAQLLTESGLLALVGGFLGLGIAYWGLELLKCLANIPPLAHAQIDAVTIGFVLGASVLCGLLCGLGPASSGARTNLQGAMGGATRSTNASSKIRHALVFTEVALACALLIGCTLMLRSFAVLLHIDPGFLPENVVTASTSMPTASYPAKPEMVTFYRRALEKLRVLPGATHTAITTHLPFGGNDWGNSFEIEGRPAPASDESAQIRPVSPEYFSTLGIPLRRGRDFTERDDEKAPGVAIINETFARRYWPNENPLGRRLRYYHDWLTIIAVCGDTKHDALDESLAGTIYAHYPQLRPDIMQFVARELNFVVRTPRGSAMGEEIRATLRGLDPALVIKVNTMQALIHDSVAQPRFRTWMITIFCGFALTLACLGIYGVVAYLVTQRYQEIGIRLALGATRKNILQLILGNTLKLAAGGILAGLAAAFFLARFLSSMLFGVTPHDAATFVAVPLGLIAIALLAGFLPALRATRIDPVRSLRYE